MSDKKKSAARPDPFGKRPLPRRKNRLRAALAAAVALALLALSLVLFLPRRPAVFSYRGLSVDGEMYAFWFSVLKKDYMVRYGISGTKDTPEFWAEAGEGGVTNGDLLTAKIDEAIKAKLVAASLFDRGGFSLSSLQRTAVNTYLDEQIANAGGGDRAALETVAAEYGTTVDALKRCALIDAKAELLYSYLYKYDGSGLPAADKESYYRSTYRRVKILYLNKEIRYSLDAGGNKTETRLTEPEKYARAQTDAALSALLPGGVTEEVFDGYLATSDEALHVAYPSGLYLYDGIDLSPVLPEAAVLEAALSLEAGQAVRVETEEGVRYLLGYALDAGAYDAKANADFFPGFTLDAARVAINRLVAESVDKVTVHEETKANYSIVDIPYNYVIKPLTDLS